MSQDLILQSSLPAALQNLRAASGQTSPASGQSTEASKVKDLAQQFEGMLLLQMIQEMQQSMGSMDGENNGGGGLMAGTGTMADTMNAAFAMQMSKYGGFGLANSLTSSLDRQIPGASAGDGPAPAPASGGLTLAPGSAPTAPAPAVSGAVNVGTPVPLVSPEAGAVDVGTPVPLAPPVPMAPAAAGTSGAGTPAVQAVPVSGPLMPASSTAELPDLPQILAAPVNSPFGWRRDPFNGQMRFHEGVDLRAAYGQDVPAAGTGKVVFAGNDGGYGLMVLLAHPGGLETRYAHLSSIAVQDGQQVQAGQTLGRVGATGRATGPHLHFEVIEDGRRVNPEAVGLELDQFKSARANAD
ncbi:MAG TPA: peptidoglycan DD-metalloendopeptidase family protein [Vicinamibacterales bacterium]|nr:peptidoglycan DD-metalloendopeptidase family protein [Vicinamibacterales bacterium]